MCSHQGGEKGKVYQLMENSDGDGGVKVLVEIGQLSESVSHQEGVKSIRKVCKLMDILEYSSRQYRQVIARNSRRKASLRCIFITE